MFLTKTWQCDRFALKLGKTPNRAICSHHQEDLKLTLMMKGDTLVNSTLKQTLLSIKGQPRVIPLFRPKPQALAPQLLGPQVDVQIVGFAGIVILEVFDIQGTPAIPGVKNPLTGQWITQPFPGTPQSVRVLFQPEFVIDATAVGGGNNSSRFVYRPLRVSR